MFFTIFCCGSSTFFYNDKIVVKHISAILFEIEKPYIGLQTICDCSKLDEPSVPGWRHNSARFTAGNICYGIVSCHVNHSVMTLYHGTLLVIVTHIAVIMRNACGQICFSKILATFHLHGISQMKLTHFTQG